MTSLSLNQRLSELFKTVILLYNLHTCCITSFVFGRIYPSMPYHALCIYTLVLQFIPEAEAGVIVKAVKSQERRVMVCPLQ